METFDYYCRCFRTGGGFWSSACVGISSAGDGEWQVWRGEVTCWVCMAYCESGLSQESFQVSTQEFRFFSLDPGVFGSVGVHGCRAVLHTILRGVVQHTRHQMAAEPKPSPSKSLPRSCWRRWRHRAPWWARLCSSLHALRIMFQMKISKKWRKDGVRESRVTSSCCPKAGGVYFIFYIKLQSSR